MTENRHDASPKDDVETPVTYETRDLSVRAAVLFGTFLVLTAIAVHLVIWLVYSSFAQANARAEVRSYPLAQVGQPPLPPAPRLQTRPREDLKALRAEEDTYLSSYGWIDRNAGVVRIPIDRAMQLLLQSGQLTWQAAPSPDAGNEPPDKSNSGRTPEEARQ
jgi:hypothetical protein